MRRSVLILWFVAACDREADQRVRCTEFANAQLAARGSSESWIETCVKERWSRKQMQCHAQNGGLLGVFCDE